MPLVYYMVKIIYLYEKDKKNTAKNTRSLAVKFFDYRFKSEDV
jgi:hypothetical protein